MSITRLIWEALPRGLRREALFGAMAALSPRIDQPEPDGQGPLVVAGYLQATTGLGAATRRLFQALADAGLAPIPADLTGPLRQGPAQPAPIEIPPGPGTLVVHVNGPMLPWALKVLGRQAVAGKRVIAVWNWELPVLPADWNRGFKACHRIWAPSRFTAEACTRPGGPPVHLAPNPVPPPDPSGRTRAEFGLPEEAFITLQVFDAASSLARKNPLGTIAAHRAAFGTHPDRLLLLKTHGTEKAGPAWAPVAEAIAATPNIRLMDEAIPRRDLWALTACADAVISLHRAEGFGYIVAEAMALGRPVVATGWSGNMDFMTGPEAHAVPVTLVPARDPQEIYDMPVTHWAEPDIEAAAAMLRDLAARRPRPAPITFPPTDYAGLLGAPPAR